MKYKIFCLLILTLFFVGCAGSILFPKMTDYYGNRVDLIQEGAILNNVTKDSNDKDIFYLSFWQNVHPVWSYGKVQIEKQKNLKKYIEKVGNDNGYYGFIVADVSLPPGYYNSYIYKIRYVKTQKEFDYWNIRY